MTAFDDLPEAGASQDTDQLAIARGARTLPGLDTSNGRWRFVWWITIPTEADVRYFDTLSDVNVPLAEIERITELECRLRKAAPAHTHLVIGYAPAS